MSKKIRDYIFILFIIFFVAGTGLVSLYASGYKISLDWPPKMNRLLTKTGMVAVDSKPGGATVYLNDEPQAVFSLNPWKKEYLTTAAKVKNVLPGEYTLSLKLDGYWPLNKKISVYPGQTTFIEDINLFRNDLPLLVSAMPQGELGLNPNYRYLSLAGAKKIITLKTGQEKSLGEGDWTAGRWLQDKPLFFANGKISSPENSGNDLDYAALIGAGASDWYYDEDNSRIYYKSQGAISYLKISDRTSQVAVSGGDYLTYEPRGSELFVVLNEGGRTILRHYSLDNQKASQEISLPSVGRYRFISKNQSYLSLYDDQNKTLYLINPGDLKNGLKTIKNIVSWEWLDAETLIYHNNWEIYLFDLRQKDAALLTRVGEEIKRIIWNKDSDYLIFSTADSLNAFDLKIGTITKILKTEQIYSPVLDDKNDILYFWAKIGQSEGAYSLRLK
jgi:hypothetical protein